MDISALSNQPISHQPHAGAASADATALRKASEEFEAIFIRQFIEKSIEPLLSEPHGTSDASGSINRHMIADVLSESLSQQGVFGVADTLEMQLRQHVSESESSNPNPRT